MIIRCEWVPDDPLYIEYHDREWGTPVHDDRTLFEYLILEGAQAGLSWLTILRKRQNYREAFDNFDPQVVALYGEKKIAALLANPGIVRHEGKLRAAVQNAKAMLAIQEAFGSLDAFIWEYVGGKTIQNSWRSISEIPAKTPIAETMSASLVRRGFKFVGPSICYAFMQAVGMVNDHTVQCFRYSELYDL